MTPVSLFTMGLWMHAQATKHQFSMPICKLSIYMISKLVIVPLIMVALAKGVGLNSEAGRWV